MPYPVEGGCDCRAVRYRLSAAPLIVHCCHCRWCQRESGAAFALNAMIESDCLSAFQGVPVKINTPSQSGRGQQIVRCPRCHVALWSHYASAGPVIAFVRVGTLDNPDLLPPDIHIFTESKQPWVLLSEKVPAVPAYYDREKIWSSGSLERRRLILPLIEAHRRSQKRPDA